MGFEGGKLLLLGKRNKLFRDKEGLMYKKPRVHNHTKDR